MNCKKGLLALVFAALLFSPAKAMQSSGNNHQIEGSWVVTVNLHSPDLPPFFEALETYDRGGGFITSNNMPFLTRVGQGAWVNEGKNYQVKIRFFKFDENGKPTGTIIVSHTITLNGDDEYSGTGMAVFREVDGSTFSVEFETEGRRLTVEP